MNLRGESLDVVGTVGDNADASYRKRVGRQRSARLVDYYDQGPMAETGRGPGATVEIVGRFANSYAKQGR